MGGELYEPPDPPGETGAVEFVPNARAFAWNAGNVLPLAGGFTANTMPC